MNLSNQYIFILGTTKFDHHYESTSFTVAKYLAQNNYVFYVENPFTWKDYFKQKGTIEFERRKEFFNSTSNGIISTEIPNLKILITPPLLSINFLPEGVIYRSLLKINEAIISKRIKRVIKDQNIKNYIYINSFNFHYPNVAESLDPILKVYHCVDPLIVPFDKRHGIISEQTLVKKSDVVICTSKQLYTEKVLLNQNTHFVPNAADISHSSKALDPLLPIHSSLTGIKKPVIGYFGNIERRLDFDLIKEIADRNPDKSFVFAGPIVPEFIPQWFSKTANIFTTGRLPYDQLPALLKGFDIALIPFKKDEVSATIFPLKLFEYLGAGKPVIATDFNPDLEEFTNGTVRFCSNHEAFSRAINEELETDSPEKVKIRIEVANNNTWTRRVDEFAEILSINIINPNIR